MDIFLADILAYLTVIIPNWYILGPGLVMIALELLEKIAELKVPGRTYFHLVFTVCLVVAMFLTWRDVYHDNKRLSGELETVRKSQDKPIAKDDSTNKLQQQLNENAIELQEQTRLNANLRKQLIEKERRLIELEAYKAERATAKSVPDRLQSFIEAGHQFREQCQYSHLDPPLTAIHIWFETVVSFSQENLSNTLVSEIRQAWRGPNPQEGVDPKNKCVKAERVVERLQKIQEDLRLTGHTPILK